MITRRHLTTWPMALLAAASSLQHVQAQAQSATVVDETWPDSTRQRQLPVKIRWPDASQPPPPGGRPVILFSHGLGGTREGGAVWGEAWAAAGFVVLHLQHPGSDFPAVREAVGSFRDRAGLRNVAGPQQLLDRLGDVRFVLDELARRQQAGQGGQGGWSSVRPTAVGMSGHSFGAHTTLGMAGQRYPGFGGVDEARLAAFIALSPSLPAAGDPATAFEHITRPLLSITGTRDDDVVRNGSTPERRMAVFGALPAGGKAHLVLKDADHLTFGGQTGRAVEIIPRAPVTRELQARHHALVARITTDWWRATLLADAAASARLSRREGLGAEDLWQQK